VLFYHGSENNAAILATLNEAADVSVIRLLISVLLYSNTRYVQKAKVPIEFRWKTCDCERAVNKGPCSEAGFNSGAFLFNSLPDTGIGKYERLFN